MVAQNKKLFLSAVSSEFESYRKLLADDLKRPTLDVAVQEDFGVGGLTTLEKLDDYIRACDGVVHLIGKATGALPEAHGVRGLLERYPNLVDRIPVLRDALMQADPGISYTQWEAWLAIYHQRPLFTYLPADFENAVPSCPREPRFAFDAGEWASQRAHHQRLVDLGRDRGRFADQERLSSAVLRDLVDILPSLQPRLHVPPTKLRHTAEVLFGRDKELSLLDAAWNTQTSKNVVVIRGKGGEGKTSLVATWMAELAAKGWRGAEAVFDWSFYSQGNSADRAQATSEFFIEAALTHFGDPDPRLGGPDERGARLARLVGAKRCLLVLDGLEPLQDPPGPTEGMLRDGGMAALLRGLAGQNAGLCVVTTRERVPNIAQHYGRSAVDHDLEFLAPEAGAALLHHAGARRAGVARIDPAAAAVHPDLLAASREMRGHALTLRLIGGYLRLTEQGDILRRDRMRLADADADAEYKFDPTSPYGHAFKAMRAYELWFAGGDAQAQRQLTLLRLLGLFDRPAPRDALRALCAEPIAGLNNGLADVAERVVNIALARLREIGLVHADDDAAGDGPVDCHPLIREYFAERLKQDAPDAARFGHSVLFDHLCNSTTDHRPDTLIKLQPLYQAVRHGCLADRHREALEVFIDRISRGTENGGYYSFAVLAAFSLDLATIASFFTQIWLEPSAQLDSFERNWLVARAASCLEMLARVDEALPLYRSGLMVDIKRQDWVQACPIAANLSKALLVLGYVEESLTYAQKSVDFSDMGLDFDQRCVSRTYVADSLNNLGRYDEAFVFYREAEAILVEGVKADVYLYSGFGGEYANFILQTAERAAWCVVFSAIADAKSSFPYEELLLSAHQAFDAAKPRAGYILAVAKIHGFAFDIAIATGCLARCALYGVLIDASGDASHARDLVANALTAMRRCNRLTELPSALMTAAISAALLDHDPEQARAFLEEAEDIALRGNMVLHLADIRLHEARLFGDRAALAEARRLIEKHGYWRRKDELEDAEAALGPG